MEFDAVTPVTPIGKERSADYWREKAECLEGWVCELLRKNQALRMDLEEQSQTRHREGKTLASSLLGLYQPPLFSERSLFKTKSASIAAGADSESCSRKEWAEIRRGGKLLRRCSFLRQKVFLFGGGRPCSPNPQMSGLSFFA